MAQRRFRAQPDPRHRWVRRWVVVDTATGRVVPHGYGAAGEVGDNDITERAARHRAEYLEQAHAA